MPTPTEAEVTALAQAIGASLQGQEHNVALSALLLLFRSIALQHPCCRQHAASTAMTVALQIAMNAHEAAPSGAPVH